MQPKYIIARAFHIFAKPPGATLEAKIAYSPGMVLEESEIPEGHTAEAWLAAGLITAAE